MPLYTVRARLQPIAALTRGAPYVEMVHHLEFASDSDAVDAMDDLPNAWVDSGISDRFVVIREQPVHTLDLFRRSISNRSSWHRLATATMTFAALPSVTGFEIEINGVGVVINLESFHLFPHTRGAVFVRERTGSPAVQRRLYVGPVSPVCLEASGLSLPLDVPGQLVIPGSTGDFPFSKEDDSIDLWRDDIRDLARDHCANIEDRAGDGVGVVPSWAQGTYLPILSTDASSVRADLRSRSRRGEMGSPTTG